MRSPGVAARRLEAPGAGQVCGLASRKKQNNSSGKPCITLHFFGEKSARFLDAKSGVKFRGCKALSEFYNLALFRRQVQGFLSTFNERFFLTVQVRGPERLHGPEGQECQMADRKLAMARYYLSNTRRLELAGFYPGPAGKMSACSAAVQSQL